MSYVSEVLADSPLIYWPMNDASGSMTAADNSGNGRDGTVTTGWNFNQPARITDSVTASTANGTGFITSPVIAFGASDLTVEMWIDIDVSKTYMPFSFGINYLDLYLSSSRIGINTGASDQYGCAITSGVHHIVVLMPNAKATTNAKIYIDGVLQTLSGTSGTAPSLASTYFKVSGWSSSGQLIPSGTYVDEVAVYSGELSAVRVAAHYNAGVAGIVTNRIVSRDAAVVLTSESGANRSVSRESVQVLGNDQTIHRSISRGSVAVINNDLVIQRTLSRMSVQVLIKSAPRYRGWGPPL